MQYILTLTSSEKLKARLVRYAKKSSDEGMEIKFVFTDNYSFFKGKNGGPVLDCYDAVLIDTSAGVKGFESAEDLRKVDRQMPVLFVESGSKKIGIGYVFNAVAYIVYEMFSYSVFKVVFSKTAELTARESEKIVIRNNDGVKVAYLDDIMYFEIEGHTVTVRLLDETLSYRGSLKPISGRLSSHGFVCCSRGCLVNLRYVSAVTADAVTLKDPAGNEIELAISKARRKPLIGRLESRYGFAGEIESADFGEDADDESFEAEEEAECVAKFVEEAES